MSYWHGYFLLWLSENLTPAQLIMVRDAILGMGRQKDDQPALITHLRQSLNSRGVIGELVLPAAPTKAQVVTALANKLGVSEQVVLNNIVTFQVSPGNTWEERRQATVAYLIAHQEDWEVGEE
jgi:hypothetical protein